MKADSASVPQSARRSLIRSLLPICLAIGAVALAHPEPLLRQPPDRSAVGATLSRMPLAFVKAEAALGGRDYHHARGLTSDVYATPSTTTFRLTRCRPTAKGARRLIQRLAEPRPAQWVVAQEFSGTRPGATFTGEGSAVAAMQRLTPSGSEPAALASAALRCEGLWEGIDLRCEGTAERVDYTLTVAPGADPEQIALVFRGAQTTSLSPSRGIQVRTGVSTLVSAAPTAYQTIGGERVPVEVRYAANARESEHDGDYRLMVDEYDPAQPLIVRIAGLASSGFLGGDGEDWIEGVAVDAEGYIYVAGTTTSGETSFPVQVGPDLQFNSAPGDNYDAFVAKISPDGAEVIYCGYIGGSRYDTASGVAVDGNGNAYVAGDTESDEGSFPVAVGPDLTYNGADGNRGDGFIAKVAADGTRLEYCGFIGGTEAEWAFGLAVDGDGRAYVAGYTASSPTEGFPRIGAPELRYGGGWSDGFIVRLRPDGSGFEYAGYIGSGNSDSADAVAVDADGAAYITGTTNSKEATFPVRGGPDLTFNGSTDCFVAKVRPDGSLEYCGYIGGRGDELVTAVAVDKRQHAYVVGWTPSTQHSFPVRRGPDRTFNGGREDGFIAKTRPDGKALVFCGYIGGKGLDSVDALCVAPSGRIYVAGFTFSREPSFPVRGGLDRTHNGGGADGFVAEVEPDNGSLRLCGYIGGSRSDGATGIAIDTAGSLCIVGSTNSNQCDFPVRGGPDTTANGADDGWIVRVHPSGGRRLPTRTSTHTLRLPLTGIPAQ